MAALYLDFPGEAVMAVTRLRPSSRQQKARRVGHPKLDVVAGKAGPPARGDVSYTSPAAQQRGSVRGTEQSVPYRDTHLHLFRVDVNL